MSEPTFQGNTLTILKEMISVADESPTECDGCTRLVSHNLCLIRVSHKIMIGTVVIQDELAFLPNTETAIEPHFWVELHDDRGVQWCIDFRLRCYMEPYNLASSVPHGIFRRGMSEHPGVIYDSYSEMPGALLAAPVYQILRDRYNVPGFGEALQALEVQLKQKRAEHGEKA